jgi:diguanylate cyclase (GGDEF)-like protein/PAS domain S-box-containing protein
MTPPTNIKAIQSELEHLNRRIADLEVRSAGLARDLDQYAQVLNRTHEGLMMLDVDQRIKAVNQTLLTLLGYEREEMAGRLPDAFFSRRTVGVFSASPNHLSFEAFFTPKQGEPIPFLFSRSTLRDPDGRVAGYAAFLIDLTELKAAQEELRESEERYRQLAMRDSLTGLYNTRHLYRQLDELTHQARTRGTVFSLIFMDMDNFKRVVDTYGHLNGSRALQEVADTIRSCLEPPEFGVAYGGDEFVVVLPGRETARARETAECIRSRMKATSYLSEAGFHVTLQASFGLATCPDDGDNRTVLLALADQAMFRVKTSGKDGIGVGSNP